MVLTTMVKKFNAFPGQPSDVVPQAAAWSWPGPRVFAQWDVSGRVSRGCLSGDYPSIQEPNAKRYDPGFPTGAVVSMEGTCLSCVKYLMVFFNALIFLAGLCLVAVGVWAVADPGGVAEVVSSHHPLLLRSVHVILAVGAVFLLLGLLGCCGALCESRRTLTFFFILLLIIFMVELVTAIVAFVFREQLNEDYFALELKMRYQGDNATDVFSRFWNSAMKTFGCCGVRGPSDFWEGTLFWQLSSGKIIPEACCKGDIHAESEATMDRLRCLLGDPRHRNEQGCYTKIMQSLHNYILTVGGVVIGLLLIQLLAMSFTLCLFRRMI
ncbi:tetraspanin-18-like isoform X1 [Lethenteron reissneri]|uniref:tetraspanin-18-like isoform X1 n=2 Tax=Lethenteron reissneri TaxID=7753 RepID=UPI002AB67FE6|nr:tetraspanin-18-like isoform X1 [Lethenteron reissneri]